MQKAEDILAFDGPLADLIDGFSSRPQQIELAQAIEQAFADSNSLICEAGTGTGKTFAYLVPALMSGAKVIISTGTKNLQDQLYQRDLPLVHRALRRAVQAALLKGRSNYLCAHALKITETENRYIDKQTLSHIHDIRQWSQHTQHGDLDELGHIPANANVRSYVTSTTENCLGQECDFFDGCHLFAARRKASDADVVIVNHHLFFADLALREHGYGELLPTADMVIFDEAHQLPDLASMFFSQTLSSRQFFDLIKDARAAYYEEAADLPEFLPLLEKVDKAVRDLRLQFGTNEQRFDWKALSEKQEVRKALVDLTDFGHSVHTALEDFAGRGKLLDNCFKRTGMLLDLLESFDDSTAHEHIRWLETRGSGFLMHRTPLNIAQAFQARLQEYACELIYTSATLAVNGSFSHFAGQLGLEEVKTAIWDSPFNFQKQALLYLPEGLPDPRESSYTEKMIEQVLPVLSLTRGRAFILFTSHRALKIASELVKVNTDYPVFVQGDAPRTELLESFRNTEHSVLLGTSSFWEGVDVKGQSLSCVIIDKLPFSSPGDPVLKARMTLLEEQGRNPFMEYQVPEAVIALKQGIGRLIRDKDDYGLLMICDPRLKTKSYGRVFVKSLPPMVQVSELDEVEAFFENFENDGD
ncbi:MAG: ATP-dependent DNA helicase [Gammaproteobacteria bacterium]|nr:ATP-dependent DNA helicase [Gammaproteobacteria bacterium]